MSYFINMFTGENSVHFAVFFIQTLAIITLAALAIRGNRQQSSLPAESDNKSKAQDDTKNCKSPPETIKRDTAVLFIDLKDFHKLSGKKEPEVVVSILNQFFETTGDAVHSAGGLIDNYMGDGLLAVFGHETSPDKGVQQALRAIELIRKTMPQLNKKLSKELSASLQIGIGLHVGPLLNGPIGHHNSPSRRNFIGPAVNTVSRLEEVAKEKGVQVIISAEAAKHANIALEKEQTEFVILRNENIPMEVLCIPAQKDIPAF